MGFADAHRRAHAITGVTHRARGGTVVRIWWLPPLSGRDDGRTGCPVNPSKVTERLLTQRHINATVPVVFPDLSNVLWGPSTPPGDLQGRSLVPMLRDSKSPGKKAAYTVVSRGQKLGKAIRSGRWRYALWPDGEELYDLEKDPNEYVNLATSRQHVDVLAALRVELVRIGKTAVARR